MATNTPNPKSYEQILGDMLSTYASKIGINDFNTGGGMISFFEAVSQAVYRSSADTFSILRDFNVDRASGEKLKRIAEEENISIEKEKVATGRVTITDSSFEKISTKIYAGAAPPNIGSTVIKVSDASEFPSNGSLYIGRGTPNIEGPLSYSAVTPVGGFFEITLDSPTTKFHNISESVVLSQGGVRTIPAGTIVLAPASGASPAITFTLTQQAVILDGENFISGVAVAAQETGTGGNVPRGAIREFTSPPFTGAAVTNDSKYTTGKDADSDAEIRAKIKRARISRGLGTAIAVKSAVLGAQAPDENAVVTSNEIFSDADTTTLFIDNGEGYEEITGGIGLEFIIDSALGGEQYFELATGGRQTSVAKAFLPSNNAAPFNIAGADKLALLVGGELSEHTFQSSDFRSEGNATAFEIVSSINANPNITFSARTIENGTKITVFARAEDNEFIQKTTPSSGNDAGAALGLPFSEVQTLRLYKNKKPISRNGRVALVQSEEQISWSNTITSGDTLTLSVDGTAEITYTFTNNDFLDEGQHSTVSKNNNLSAWVNVINTKITGVTASINGNRIVLTSNLGTSSRASLSINPLSTLVSKGMFSTVSGLTAQGKEADFTLSRNTAQFKLREPLEEGESLTAGTEFTKGNVESNPILGGSTTITSDAYFWFLIDNKDAIIINTGITADTTMDVLKPSANIVRYESNNASAFANVVAGDWVILWSEELNVNNRLEAKIYNAGANFIELRVTPDEWAAAVVEGPIIWKEGIQVVRTDQAIQKVKVPAASYNINTLASLFDSAIVGATARSEKDELLIITTETEDESGEVFLTTFNDPAKALNFEIGQRGVSEASLFAFYESGATESDFPLFIFDSIANDKYADPPNSLIENFDSTIDLASLGVDPNVIINMLEPYNNVEDNISVNESVQIDKLTGTVIDIDVSQLIRRLRENDRYYVSDTFQFAANDSIVVILDADPSTKTFSIPLYRRAIANNTMGINANNFRAYDTDSGATAEFATFFGSNFDFKNYRALMQARNVVHPTNPLVDEDAILYRCIEFGRAGERYNVGYTYPTAPNQEISSTVQVNEKAVIRMNLKSGDEITNTINGTTSWDVTITNVGAVDQVTYTYNGTGSAPALDPSLSSGGYVTINQAGEFNVANTGTFKVISATASSFTVVRAIGSAVAETNKACLTDSTIIVYELSDTTAQEIVTYVTDNLADYITAELIDDNGDTGAGVIAKSTEEDTDFAATGVDLVDGMNWIDSSDLAAVAPTNQFRFKNPLTLPSFNTATLDAYAFNQGEEVRFIPTTAKQTAAFTNVLAVSGYSTIGDVNASSREGKIQLRTQSLGSGGTVQIAGGNANGSAADVLSAASQIPDTSFMKATILKSGASGFQVDQWVKLSGGRAQKKDTGMSFATVVSVTPNEPTAGQSTIELSNREAQDLYFGEPRNFFRDRGRTFHVEKHGTLTCISWNGVGDSPVMAKPVEINFGASDISVNYNEITGYTEYTVESGPINFSECQRGDKFTISGLSEAANDGTFNVIGVSDDGKTIVVDNFNGVDATVFAVNEQQRITFLNVPTAGAFTIEFDGQTTASIPYTANAAAVEAALELLSNIDDVNVTGDFSTGFLVEFLGTNANTDVPLMTIPSNTLLRSISQVEEFDFTGLTGELLDDSSTQIEEYDFTGLTGTTLDAKVSQIENFDFTGLLGSNLEPALLVSQIEDWDFTGLTGATFDVVGAGLKLNLAGGLGYVWFNVTDGANAQSDPTGTGVGIQVDIVLADTPTTIANLADLAIEAAGIHRVQTVSNSIGVLTVNYRAGDFGTDGDAGTSTTAFTKQQDGSGVCTSIQLADGSAYLWFNVTDGAVLDPRVDPTGTGMSVQVDTTAAANANAIASAAAVALAGALPIAGISAANFSGDSLLVTYDGGVITTNGADVDAGAAVSIDTAGADTQSIQLGGNLAYLWFNVTDGANTQADPSGNGTAIQVDVVLADTPTTIASKADAAIDAAAIAGIDTVGNTTGVLSITYDQGDVTPDGFDVNTGAAFTLVQNGITVNTSKSIQLADGNAYLWFNVTDSLGANTDPTGTGTSIQVNVLEADLASALASKAAAAITAALPIAGLSSASSTVEKLSVTYSLGAITTDGADVDTGVAYTKVTAGFGPENTTTNVTEEVQGGNLDSLTVQAEIREGDSVIIGAPFTTLNRGIFRVIRRYNDSFYIENSNTVEEVVTVSDSLRSLGIAVDTELDVVVSSGIMRIEWNGNGTQPTLNEAKYGDVLKIGTDFAADNQGEFSVTRTGDNFIECSNAKAVAQTAVTVADVFEAHDPSIQFAEYDVTVPSDRFVISGDVFNDTNVGEYQIVEVLDKNTAVVGQILAPVSSIQLEEKFTQVYVEESIPYTAYKKIYGKAVDPSNANRTNLIFDTDNQFLKVNKDVGEVTLSAVGKFNFNTTIRNGLDSYRYHTGLIAESNRIVYGDPADNSTYPGVSAAGAEIFIQPPLVRRIEVGVGVRLQTGIPFNKIIEQVRTNIAALINSSPIGQSIAISDIVASVNSISGVRAVSVTSPLYDINNDVIVINPSEKPFILDEVNDISVSKVE